MKLVYLKENVVVNVATFPEGDVDAFKSLIIERGIRHTSIDQIIDVEDDCRVQVGDTYDGKKFLETPREDQNVPLTLESLKAQIDELKTALPVKSNGAV